jgi:acyl-CoA thioesterase-1
VQADDWNCLQVLERMPVRASILLVTIGVGVASINLFAQGSAAAQEPASKPETQAPAPTQTVPSPSATATTPVPATTASGHPADAYWTAHDKQLLTDFGWLARYKDANEKLPKPAPDEKRVVFMGDSITEGWHFDGPDGSFSGKPFINRGISGQTSPQMLVRFRQDVVDLQPRVVVILAGTNDVAGNTGPMTLEQTEANIASMAEIAKSNGIRVVLCSVLPAFDFPWKPGMEPAPKINAINTWIKSYAAEKGHVYVDYHSAMKDARDGLPPNLSGDGVHPKPAGYAIMAPLVEAGIAKALAD